MTINVHDVLYIGMPILLEMLPFIGIAVVNGAPGIANVDSRILQQCDVFCVNETEVSLLISVQFISFRMIMSTIFSVTFSGHILLIYRLS